MQRLRKYKPNHLIFLRELAEDTLQWNEKVNYRSSQKSRAVLKSGDIAGPSEEPGRAEEEGGWAL